MKPLFHFPDLWKCFVRLFEKTDRVNTEDGSTLYMQDNLAIDGNLGVSGDILSDGSIQANEIVEIMEGYSFAATTTPGWTGEVLYAGAVKNGNKLTLVLFGKATKTDADAGNYPPMGEFTIPSEIASKITPSTIGGLTDCVDTRGIQFVGTSFASPVAKQGYIIKTSNKFTFGSFFNTATVDTEYTYRYEVTFLLSDNLAS